VPVTMPSKKKLEEDKPLKITPHAQLASALFKQIDKDGNGSLSKAELSDLLKSLHQNPTDEVLSKFLGGSPDGEIDFETFMARLSNQPSSSSAEWDAFFKLLDIDGNGKVTAPEICSTLHSLGYTISDDDIDNIIIEFDDDGNGSLSSNELREIAERILKESQ